MAFEHVGLVAAKVIVLALGAAVAGLAFLAWRRTGKRLMLFIAVAFSLIAFGSFAGGMLFEFFGWSLFAVAAVETLFVLCGLLMLVVLLRPRGAGS